MGRHTAQKIPACKQAEQAGAAHGSDRVQAREGVVGNVQGVQALAQAQEPQAAIAQPTAGEIHQIRTTAA